LELGRGYESDNQVTQAERAYQQAQTLAPRYFETHWALANFYLRNTRTEEALRAFRTALELSGEKAGETDARAALNAYEAVSQGLGMNLVALRQIAPPDARAQAYLAKYLAEHQALDAALEIWRGLPTSAQRERHDILPSLLAAAQASGRFQEARELWRAAILSKGLPDWTAPNLIYNGGFEREFIPDAAGFDWQATSHAEVFLRRDDVQAHTGRYVWRMTFAAQMKSELNGPTQLLVVEPNKAYRLRFFAKTTKVPDNAPFIELTDAERPQLFAVRAPVPTGTQEWREVALTFTTPAETRALRLVIRAPQLTAVNTGHIAEVWLDDFSLEPDSVTR
jgi:tetratricopeptide (TPR) repeat protein